MKGQYSRWILFAKEDLSMAKLALKEKIYNQVCFHAHQCVEKSLKGVIQHTGSEQARTHKLVDLLLSVRVQFQGDLRDSILALDRFYIPTRYPDALPGSLPEGTPSENEAKEALDIAKKVLAIVIREVKD